MHVGILSIQHESNTFIQGVTSLDDFSRDVILTGEDIRERYATSAHEVGGFFTGLNEQGITAVPTLFARAIPSGTISRDAAGNLLKMLHEEVTKAGPLDGWLVAPHGAAVSELDRDFDGLWLAELRSIIGPEIPVVCTLDAHANLSQRMVDLCNATVVYRTNPHVDQRDRGIEAARLMGKTLRGEIRPTQAACFAPLAINIERQHTSSEPCASLYRAADECLARSGVLSNSVVLGFPYADVAEMGTSFIVVTDNDRALASSIAQELSDAVMSRRTEFEACLISIDAALDQAAGLAGPVCLLDMGDNVGGGSPADGTLLLHALADRKNLTAFVCLYDPPAAQAALQAGAGATLQALAMGGKTDSRHGPPFIADVRVLSLHDGAFKEDQIRHGGSVEFKMGPTAIVSTGSGLTMMLNSLRTPPFSLRQLTSCGIDPTEFDVLVAKGVQAPVAAYRDVCPHLIRVNTPGVTSAEMLGFEYQYRRRPLFPFESVVPGH